MHRFSAIFEDPDSGEKLIVEGIAPSGWTAMGHALVQLKLVHGYTDEQLAESTLVIRSFMAILMD